VGAKEPQEGRCDEGGRAVALVGSKDREVETDRH
jgi:hypothetical protein